jgi:hypothetical protein
MSRSMLPQLRNQLPRSGDTAMVSALNADAELERRSLVGPDIRIIIDSQHVAVVDRTVKAVHQCWEWLKMRSNLSSVWFGRDGLMRFPAGLVADVVRALEADEYRVTICDCRPTLFPVAESMIEKAEGADRRFLSAVANSFTGVVEFENQSELVHRLVQIVALCPTSQLIIATPTRKRAGWLWKSLGEALKRPAGLVTAKRNEMNDRCVVCTYKSLAKITAAPNSVLAIVDVEQAGDTLAQYAVGDRAFRRVYAFLGDFAALNDETMALRIQALAGEAIYSVAFRSARGRVLMISAPKPHNKSTGNGLQRKRRMIWKNRARNRFISQIAMAALNGDLNQLRQYGVHVDLAELGDDNRRVIVLVESTAHARELRSLLRGWPILCAAPTQLKIPECSDDHSGADSRGSIVTVTHAVLNGWNEPIIIRATGERGDWSITRNPDHPGDGEPTSALVIDICDQFDDQAQSDSRLRIQDYRWQGWRVEENGSRA